MNRVRRKALEAISSHLASLVDELETIKGEEEDYRDNIPENLQGSRQYEKADEACDSLDDAISSLEDVIDCISAAVE